MSIVNCQFFLAILFVLLGNGSVALAQFSLVETEAAMAIGSGADAQGAKAATKEVPGALKGGPIDKLAQQNAERNAGIEGDAAAPSGAENPPMEGEAAPEAPAASAAPTERNVMQTGWWGPGGYFSTIKLLLLVFTFLFWVQATGWMNADLERLKKANREGANFLNFALFAFLAPPLFFAVFFWAVFPVLFLASFVNCMVYIVVRNAKLPPHEKVLTAEHIEFCYASLMNRIGVKVKVKKRKVYEVGAPIDLEATGKNLTEQILQGRLVLARNQPGYNDFRQHLFDALETNATHLMLDFTPQQTTVKHQVDGVWLSLPPIPRVIEKGRTKDAMEEMLEAAKMLAGANPVDRRSRQVGTFLAVIRKKTKYDVEFLSQGTQTGEAVMIQFVAKKVPFKSLDELGMRPELQTKFREHINAERGLFVACAPSGQGLRSSMDVFCRNCDRFTRDVVNIEDVQSSSEVIENVVLVKYDSAKGETPMTVLPDVIFKEPHALIVKDMARRDVLEYCLPEVDNPRLFFTMTRAKDGVEAIFQFLGTKVPPQDLLSRMTGTISQRLVRKLCSECKEPYQPTQQLMQQLGIKPDQVKELFRVRTPLADPYQEKKRGVCENCSGIGYKGRTALFELIHMTDDIRAFIAANPDPVAIRQMIIKSGQTGFFYEGVRLLMQGDTTVEELSRVMKM